MPRLLLVEDNEMNRDMLARRLERRGYQVVVAVDGAEAIAKAESESPDLILMDMSLPVIDGWEASRRLKAGPATRRIPLIALTAHAMAGDREKALRAGCDDFDTKPVDLPRLLEKIQQHLGNATGPVAGPPKEEPLELTCPALMANLPVVHALADRACGIAGASQADAFAVRLAVEEVFGNIVRHGYPPAAAGPVALSFAIEPGQIRITVADEAPVFDPRQVRAPELGSGAHDRELGGLGWHLVFNLMDEVRHEAKGRRGNRVVLVKRLTGT